MKPNKIISDKNLGLIIRWDNGEERIISFANLRRNCPCALCLVEREKENPGYIPIFNGDQVTIEDINLTGDYGINIIWRDKHNSGIYEYELLRNIRNLMIKADKNASS